MQSKHTKNVKPDFECLELVFYSVGRRRRKDVITEKKIIKKLF